MTLGEELLQDQIDRLDEDKRDLTKMLALAIQALKKIASPTQTNALLWWQIEAREALAKVGAGGTAPDGHNDRVERPGAASGDRSARTTGCAANGINNERTEK